LAKATAAIARTTSGAIDPASIPPKTTTSNSSTEGASLDESAINAIRTGNEASTVRTRRRQRPESWRRVSR
jgi:hypothetical protein